MTLWMLDTNILSAAVHHRSPQLDARLSEVVKSSTLYVSAISFGETLYGLAHKPEARNLAKNIDDFFSEVEVLNWTEATAQTYGDLRAEMRRVGRSLQPLDMLIAAHALEAGATLVTNNRAFTHVPGLTIEDWTV